MWLEQRFSLFLIPLLWNRLYFCARHFWSNWQMLTFSQAHSHALTNATSRHEYFRGLSRLLPVRGVLVSFLELRFLGKMALLALRGRPQPLKKPSQSQKGHFYEKMNALNDTKTSELSKSAEGKGEYLWSSVAFGAHSNSVNSITTDDLHNWTTDARSSFSVYQCAFTIGMLWSKLSG